MEISSVQNNRIKNLIKLGGKSRERKNQNLFVVEGIQENNLALSNGFEAVEFYVQKDIFNNALKLPNTEIFEITQNVFDKIAYRSTTGGLLGVYKVKNYKLLDLDLNLNPLILVLESIEKPGNLGAILRTADASGVDAVVVCDTRADFFNPNVIRSSVGTVFTNRVILSEKEDIIEFCQNNNIQILPTYLRDDTKNLYQIDLKQGTAFIFGTESTGLSDFWELNAAQTVKIPMLGQVDSLNVSNAVAVCVYEAVRQRFG